MSIIQTFSSYYEFNRSRTLGLLDKIEQQADAPSVLGWRPGEGRAHIGWQLTHIGISEEIFASERLAAKDGRFRELWPRFRGGSKPDDDIPATGQIREVLAAGREDLLATIAEFNESQLDDIVWETPDGRRLSLASILQILCWHEAHHQGQAHLTFNLWNASQK